MNIKPLCLIGLSLVLGLSSTLGSCKRKSEAKPLSELKKDQSKVIDRLLEKRGLQVVALKDDKLPSPVDNNVFYKMPNGLYMHIIKEGNGGKAIAGQTLISIYCKGYMTSIDKEQGTSFNNLSSPAYPPLEIRYIVNYSLGWQHYELIPQSSLGTLESLMCEGLAYPMSLLSDGAVLELIVPFEIGPSVSYTSGVSMYVEEVEYQFHK